MNITFASDLLEVPKVEIGGLIVDSVTGVFWNF